MDRRKALHDIGLIVGAPALMPTLFSLLQSCQSESRLDWQPEFLDDDQARFIAALVDKILPRTETPGGLDVKVDIFLDKVFAKTLSEEAQQKVKTQIAEFNEKCRQEFGNVFVKLNDSEATAVLKDAEALDPKFNGSVWGTSVGKQEPVGFYRTLKSMALWGYLTSEEIGENVLSYDPIPQEYLGCIPLSDVGNRWSL